MKNFTLLLFTLLLSATHSFAQLKVTKIKSKDQDHFIATVIGYPVAGVYTLVNQIQPTTKLNEDGTGFIQNEDLEKENIIWGIECSEWGIPIFKEGFSSASYTLWYEKTNTKTADELEWESKSFSIHYEKKKIFIDGERVKDYME